MQRFLHFSRFLLIQALLVGLLALLAACSAAPEPGAGQEQVADEGEQSDTAQSEESTQEESDSQSVDTGAKIDLSGLSVRFSSEQPHTINTTFFKMVDILREWGADAEIIFHAGSTYGIQTVLANEVDVAESDTDELLLGVAQGAAIEAFMTNTARMDYVLVAREDIKEAADLTGKKIGMSGPAGFDALLSRVYLSQNNIDPSGASFVQIGGSGDRAAALGAGRIDAATIFVDDWLELQQKAEGLHAAIYMADIVPNITKGVYYARDDWVKENKEMLVGISCAQLEANKWFHESEEEWVQYALERVEGASEEAVRETYSVLKEIDMFPRDGGFQAAGVEKLMSLMLETGDLEANVPLDDVMNRSYLDEALEKGCGQ